MRFVRSITRIKILWYIVGNLMPSFFRTLFGIQYQTTSFYILSKKLAKYHEVRANKL